MVTKRVWFGSTGPFFYDDAADLLAMGALPAGTDQHGVATEGQLFINTAPTLGQHVLRKQDILNAVWPVGSVFIAVVSTNPNTLLGGGTWAAFGTGRVLVGIDVADADFDTVEETGGAKTIASVGTVSQPTFTGNVLSTHLHTADGTLAAANESAHTHGAGSYASDTNAALNNTNVAVQAGAGTTVAADGHSHSHSHTVTGTSAAGSTHGHDVTGDTSSVTGGTPSGTVSQPTFAGSPTSVVQPYIVVYIWKRTA